MKDPDVGVRTAAITGLHRYEKDRRAIDALKGAIKDPASLVRRMAIEALGRAHAAEIFDDLVRLLDDGDRDVVGATAGALGRLRDPRAVGPLLLALERGDPNGRGSGRPEPRRFDRGQRDRRWTHERLEACRVKSGSIDLLVRAA